MPLAEQSLLELNNRELLKLTGVDLLNGDAMEAAFNSFESALIEFENLN